MGGFLDGIDGIDIYRRNGLYRRDRHLMDWIDFIDWIDIYRWDRLYRLDRHLIDKINYYRQMDGMGT